MFSIIRLFLLYFPCPGYVSLFYLHFALLKLKYWGKFNLAHFPITYFSSFLLFPAYFRCVFCVLCVMQSFIYPLCLCYSRHFTKNENNKEFLRDTKQTRIAYPVSNPHHVVLSAYYHCIFRVLGMFHCFIYTWYTLLVLL